MFDPGTTAKLSDKTNDKLAKLVLDRFRSAVMWQETERVGDVGLRSVLTRCHEQYHGVWSAMDRARVDKLQVDARVNLTAMKAGVVQSFLAETLIRPDALPWAISPTPLPDLSESGRRRALDRFKQRWFSKAEPFTGSPEDLARMVKRELQGELTEEAKTKSRAMEKLMRDQCVEGGWRTALQAFLHEFAYMPYAVLAGPTPVRRPTLEWRGDTPRVAEKLFYDFQAVSVFDFWYSSDSPDTQRGAGVFIRQRWTRPRLLAAAKMRSYDRGEIYQLLAKDLPREDFRFHWLSDNPDRATDLRRDWVTGVGAVDALLHYGLFSGRELADHGVAGLEAGEFYNAAVTVIGGRVIQAVTAHNPAVNIRPVHTASFYPVRDRIPGAGIAQRLRDVERCFLSALGYLMRNAANAAEPIIEGDYSRLSKYLGEEDLARITPGAFYPVDNDGLTNTAPALRFTSIPSAIGDYHALLNYFLELAHLATNLPAALHGVAQGTGVNRTFRGAAMLQGNAIKAIQSAVGSIDQGVFFPCGELLFNYNMLYEKDDDIKGDCRILAQGVQGLLAREMNRNNAMELLQLVGAAGAQLGERAPRLFAWSLNQLLLAMDVPEELLAEGDAPVAPPAEAPMGPMDGGAAGAPAAAPGVPNGGPGMAGM